MKNIGWWRSFGEWPAFVIRHSAVGTCIASCHQSPDATSQPFFAAERAFHRVGREAALLLGTGRAALLHLAHPLVAAGIAEHSRFHAEPFHRLQRTIDLMSTLTFGSPAQAEAALRRFHAVHAQVRGRLAEDAGRYAAGAAYAAGDPELIWWVLAASMDTRLRVYERFVAPLAPAERAELYTDVRRLAGLLGVPAALVPPTFAGFQAYLATTLTSDTLAVTSTTRRLAQGVLFPPTRGALRIGAGIFRLATAGLLPAPLRAAYGLPWGMRHQLAFDALAAASRALLPIVPAGLRQLGDAQRGSPARRLIEAAARAGPTHPTAGSFSHSSAEHNEQA